MLQDRLGLVPRLRILSDVGVAELGDGDLCSQRDACGEATRGEPQSHQWNELLPTTSKTRSFHVAIEAQSANPVVRALKLDEQCGCSTRGHGTASEFPGIPSL